MTELQISSDWSFRGLSAIVFENRILRIIVLPSLGGKIWQIVYKTLDEPLLWNNPGIAPDRQRIRARYDDVWAGGWDELFPNDESATINGELYPDHGEFWTGDWHATPFQADNAVGVDLTFTTPISSVKVHKRISLQAGIGRLDFSHHFQNLGGEPLPFLWKLHPAFAVTPAHRLVFPAMKVVMERAFTGTLNSAPDEFDWPICVNGETIVDLREVPSFNRRQMYFFYGTALKEGRCGIVNTASGLSCSLQFDPAVFSSCWLFASYGGWRNNRVAVLEPCTGYPIDFETMKQIGRVKILEPGGSLATQVVFSAEEGVALEGV